MKITVKHLFAALTLMGLSFASGAMAEKKAEKKSAKATEKKTLKQPTSAVSSRAPTVPAKAAPEKVSNADAQDGYVTGSSTHLDFSETSIDGKMKAPDGFMLQGHQSSSLSQMVKLRSNFRNELNNSKSATRALVK
jgi:hypothetical protein